MKTIERRANGTKRVKEMNEEPTKTQQQFQDQVNVNNIMKKYKKTGTVTHLRNAQQGVYMDLTEIPDYASSLMQIQKAEQAFSQIPAELRLKFNNDPSKLISYLRDPANLDEAVKHGLLVKRENEQNPNPNENANNNSQAKPASP